MSRFDRLWEAADLTRRALIASGAATGVVSGFAAAVQPVMAQTMIMTELAGLDAGWVQISAGDVPIPAYRAVQAGAKARPLVLVVHEIFDVHEHIADVCRRLGTTSIARRAEAAAARR